MAEPCRTEEVAVRVMGSKYNRNVELSMKPSKGEKER